MRATLTGLPVEAGITAQMVAHWGQAVAHYEEGRFFEAVQEWNQVLAIHSDLADVHYNLGLTLLELGQEDVAVSHLREAIRLAPAGALRTVIIPAS